MEDTSIETTASQQSENTLSSGSPGEQTTSSDSDTIKVYDFVKQETTTLVKNAKDSERKESTKQSSADTENEQAKKARPSMLALGTVKSESLCSPAVTPIRGSTPDAFKFLQPKRKILDPSQVLTSCDESDAVSAQ